VTGTLVVELGGNPTVIGDEETPLGATASGSNDAACSVNSDVPWAMAAGLKPAKTRQKAHRHTAANPLCPPADFTFSDHSDLNMNGFCFN
jgi:hypothetical protein